jgi:hypothetical protein
MNRQQVSNRIRNKCIIIPTITAGWKSFPVSESCRSKMAGSNVAIQDLAVIKKKIKHVSLEKICPLKYTASSLGHFA